MSDHDPVYYEDPDFYAGINEGIFGMISGIMSLVEQGEGGGSGGGAYGPQQAQDMKPLYIGFGVLGFLLLILIVVMVIKK